MAEYWELDRPKHSVNEKGERQRTRRFLVVDESLTFTGSAAISLIPIYRLVSVHPEDPYCLARTADATAVDGRPGYWIIEYQYDSADFDSGSQGTDPADTSNETNPPDRAWTIKWSSTHTTKILGPKDKANEDVVAKNGQPFDPPIEIPTSRMILSVSGYVPLTVVPSVKIQAYQDTINDNVWQGFAAKTLKVNELSFERTFTFSDWFYKFELTFEFKPDGWNPVKVLNAGTYQIVSMSEPPQPIRDAEGNPVKDPVPLDNAGKALNAGAALIYLDFKGYDETDFTNILT